MFNQDIIKINKLYLKSIDVIYLTKMKEQIWEETIKIRRCENKSIQSKQETTKLTKLNFEFKYVSSLIEFYNMQKKLNGAK